MIDWMPLLDEMCQQAEGVCEEIWMGSSGV